MRVLAHARRLYCKALVKVDKRLVCYRVSLIRSPALGKFFFTLLIIVFHLMVYNHDRSMRHDVSYWLGWLLRVVGEFQIHLEINLIEPSFWMANGYLCSPSGFIWASLT